MRARLKSLIMLGSGVLALALVSGCARPVGDLGRAEPGVLHDAVMPRLGAVRAQAMGEPVSRYNLTDEERAMQDRVWRFLIAPHAKDWFYDSAVELQRTRLTPDTDLRFARDRYYRHLAGRHYASSRVRYQSVANDIWLDNATLPSTLLAICKVVEVDRRRAIALANVEGAASDAVAQVQARRAENQSWINWFTRALRYRYDAYTVALDRLLVETPHEQARLVEARLESMRAYVRRAEAGEFCTRGGSVTINSGATLPSRLEHGGGTTKAPERPIYRK